MELKLLGAIGTAKPVTELGADEIKELQLVLGAAGYYVGAADGLIGPKTRTAWAIFETDAAEGNPQMVDPQSVAALQKKVDSVLGTAHDFSDRDHVIQSIRQECAAIGLGLATQAAYVLATVEWETARTFKPVREAFWQDEQWRKDNLRYYPYYGRGYVQLTWKNNYEYYGGLLGLDLAGNPDLALDAEAALFILAHGFRTGMLTTHKLTEYVNADKTDFVNARRCINGVDHASNIAALAQKYLGANQPPGLAQAAPAPAQ